MFPRIPKAVFERGIFGPLLDVLDSDLMTPQELGARWRYTDQHLSNLRRAGRGPRFTKIPDTGGVRYYVSDIIGAELTGLSGRISPDDVALLISSCAGVPEQYREAIIEHVRKGLKPRE